MLVHAITANLNYEFATDVRAGLTKPGQKELLSKYLYDDVGSALFEVISRLPEYGLTRADERLLQRHAEEIVERVATPLAVAELGSGSGKKHVRYWKLSAGASARHTIPSRSLPLLLPCASANSATLTASIFWASSANILMDCWKWLRNVDLANTSSCSFWAARSETLIAWQV